MTLRKSSNESALLDGAAVDCRMENGCLCFRVPPSLHEARAELCACIERAASSAYDSSRHTQRSNGVCPSCEEASAKAA